MCCKQKIKILHRMVSFLISCIRHIPLTRVNRCMHRSLRMARKYTLNIKCALITRELISHAGRHVVHALICVGRAMLVGQF